MNKDNELIIYLFSIVILIGLIGIFSNSPAILAIITYCLGIASVKETKNFKNE